MSTEWERWVREVTEAGSSRAVAERIGKSHTTALKWMSAPTPESAIMLAIAYQANPIEALTVAGFLKDGHILDSEPDLELRDVPTVRLTAELYRRAAASDRKRQTALDSFEELRPPISDPAAQMRTFTRMS